MGPLDKIRPIDVTPSASQKVAERLTSLIASGNIAPGDKLPSENQLSKALHVSRPVVREALRGLTMMGVVESKQGGGSYVTDLDLNRLMAPLSFVMSLQEYSLESLFTARTVIDGGLAGEAARNVTPAQLERFAELVELAYRTVADPIAFRLADVEFHELIGTGRQQRLPGPRLAGALQPGDRPAPQGLADTRRARPVGPGSRCDRQGHRRRAIPSPPRPPWSRMSSIFEGRRSTCSAAPIPFRFA